jgi:hypothetical protein
MGVSELCSYMKLRTLPQETSLLPDLHYQDQEVEYCKELRSLFSRQLYLESPKSVTMPMENQSWLVNTKAGEN